MAQDDAPLADLDPELLERLRQSGLRLDREGRFWHEGALVTHPRLAAALHRWLDRLDDGRFILRLDGQRYLYIEVQDAPFQVRTLTLDAVGEGVRVVLHLDDGTEEELSYDTVQVGPDDALYCRVKGRFEARFSRQACQLLAPHIVQQGDGFALRAMGGTWAITPRGST